MSTKLPLEQLDSPKLREKLKRKSAKLKAAREEIEKQREVIHKLRSHISDMTTVLNAYTETPIKSSARMPGSSNLTPVSPGPRPASVQQSQSFNTGGANNSTGTSNWSPAAAAKANDVHRSVSAGGAQQPLTRSPAPASAPATTVNSSNLSTSTSSGRKGAGITPLASGGSGDASVQFHKLCLDGPYEAVLRQLEPSHLHSVNINYKDKNDWTPLHNAASVGRLDICEALLKIETIDLTPNNDGNYPLHYVVRHGTDSDRLLRVLKLFLERKANFNVANNYGETPLHTACLKCNTTAVNFLLAQGANPNIKNARGETPLHFAVRSGNLNNITQLLRFGADPKIAANNQGTALDIAASMKNQQVLSVLRDPKYLLIPVSLHSIHLEEYVPVFALNNITDTAFRRMREEDLMKMEIPPEDRKKMLELIARLNSSPNVDLEELSWEIAFQTLQIEEEIGRGSSGVVWRAVWKGREVAVKQLVYTSEQQLQDFLSELEIMKRVRLHENVVNLLGVCKSPFFAIVSEYLPMGSLDRLLLTLDLEMFDILNLIRGCTAGVAFLHQQNIIHRDIACRNLLATKDANGKLTVKLTDFGMSRFNKPEGNRGQMNFGPLKWMAPEALSYKYVIKTDIWSLGITMIEMLTHGGDPWPGESPTNVAIAVRDQRKTPKVPEGTPAELEQVMRDCWRYEPDNRPSAEEVLTHVNRLVWKWNKAMVAAGKTPITAGPSTGLM